MFCGHTRFTTSQNLFLRHYPTQGVLILSPSLGSPGRATDPAPTANWLQHPRKHFIFACLIDNRYLAFPRPWKKPFFAFTAEAGRAGFTCALWSPIYRRLWPTWRWLAQSGLPSGARSAPTNFRVIRLQKRRAGGTGLASANTGQRTVSATCVPSAIPGPPGRVSKSKTGLGSHVAFSFLYIEVLRPVRALPPDSLSDSQSDIFSLSSIKDLLN